MDTQEIFARVIRDYDNHVVSLVEEGYPLQSLNVSKAHYSMLYIKRRIKDISKEMKKSSEKAALNAEEWVNRVRAELQGFVTKWSERAERGLNRWVLSSGRKGSNLLSAIREISKR